MTSAPMVVALDVDGTLFDGASVDPRAVSAVRSARAAGHVITIVTGRPWSDLLEIIPGVVEHATIAVCEHGALMVDVDTRAVTHLTAPVSDEIRQAIIAAGLPSTVLYDSTIGLDASAREFAEELCARPGSGCYVVGNKDSIAIVPIGCDKGTGLTRAIAALGVGDRGVIAIGDATNDLPMFEQAAIAVAVANAEPALVETGIEVTERPFGGGVAEALGKHLGIDVADTSDGVAAAGGSPRGS